MRTTLLCLAALSALALAGCSDDGGHEVEAVTCPDGTVLTPDVIEGSEHHHMEGFNATSLCPEEPSVSLEGIPSSLQVFKSAGFRWTIDNGSMHHAHSMLTSIRFSSASVPDRDLTNVNKYPNELIKREHQDLPVSYEGNLSFSRVGKVYLRAYAEIAGVDHWSPEVVLNVTPVPPSGRVIDVTHGPGDFASPPEPSQVPAVIGDAIRLVNEDVLPHTCSFANGPAAVAALEAPAQGASAEVLLFVPGTYVFECDELQAQSFTVNVVLN